MATENTQRKPAKKRRSKNPIVRYFTPFGVRQICDILLFVAAITVIVGMIVYKSTDVVLIVGISLFLAGALLAVYRSSRILLSGINKRSPEFKSAMVNTIIMGVITVVAILGLVFCFV